MCIYRLPFLALPRVLFSNENNLFINGTSVHRGKYVSGASSWADAWIDSSFYTAINNIAQTANCGKLLSLAAPKFIILTLSNRRCG